MTANQNKPWGGRFTETSDHFVETFTESVSYDKRLYHYDIIGSIAHVNMLANTGIITKEEKRQIVSALKDIEKEIKNNLFNWSIQLEDVHMNIEAELVKRIGEAGKKMHTGRSRNDQIATDIRLYLRAEQYQIEEQITTLIKVLLDIAKKHQATIMPGLTHLQIAQPITLGHHLLAWCEMLLRDRQRLQENHKRLNILPLGAAALAGTSLPIDREQVAKSLGFTGIAQNSLDAVSDRDFVIEFCACCSLLMMHLSRYSEELILWMSTPFQFIELGDAWCTGSSIMPQKKNPDIPELVRGKTARIYGGLMALLTLMKAQPLAYNRDNQEDKMTLFDVVDTVKLCLQAYIGMMPTMTVNSNKMHAMAIDGYSTATDLADYLVRRGIPFRDAHAVTGKITRYAIEQKKRLDQLSLEELQSFSAIIEQDIYRFLTVEGSVALRDHTGGTAPRQVAAAIDRINKIL